MRNPAPEAPSAPPPDSARIVSGRPVAPGRARARDGASLQKRASGIPEICACSTPLSGIRVIDAHAPNAISKHAAASVRTTDRGRNRITALGTIDRRSDTPWLVATWTIPARPSRPGQATGEKSRMPQRPLHSKPGKTKQPFEAEVGKICGGGATNRPQSIETAEFFWGKQPGPIAKGEQGRRVTAYWFATRRRATP